MENDKEDEHLESSFAEVLKNPYFVILWIAQTFSQFGDRIFLLFMVVLVTKNQFSNSAVSGLTLVYTIPAVIFGSVAGVFIDRWNKRNAMIICNFLRAIGVAFLLFSDSIWYIYLITFIVSTLTQFFAPAEASMIPHLVEKKNLLPANSMFMGTMFSSVVFGFALGAPIISQFSESTTTISIAVMYLIGSIILLFISGQEDDEEKEEKHFFEEFKDGYHYVIKNKTILFCVIRQIIVFSAFAALSVLVIGFVNDVLYLKPVFFGYLLAVAGAGMGGGALFAGKFGNRIGKDPLIFSGFIISGLMLIALSCTNQISWFLGLEKTEQKKELYSALSSLNDNNKNQKVLAQINAIFMPNNAGEPKITQRTKLEAFSDSQMLILADLLKVKKEKLLELKKDEKTKKINLGKLLNSLSKEEFNFIDIKRNYIRLNDNPRETTINSKSLKYFIKLQNTFIIQELFKTGRSEDKVLNSIMILTDNNIANLQTLRSFMKLNDEGIPTMTLQKKISQLSVQNTDDLANLLGIENEDLVNQDIQINTIKNYLDKVSNEDASSITIKKANAIKTLFLLHKSPIIKMILKQESSLFEISLAFFVTIVVGFGSALSAIPLQAILQEIVEENMRGKVFGVQNMLINTAMTIPMVISGFLADSLDGRIFNMKGVSAVMILTALFILFGGFIENAFKQKNAK